MAKRSTKRNRLILYVFLGLVGILFIILYVIPALTGALTPTTLVEYGSIQIVDQATVTLIRSEKVVKAQADGELRYYFDEGEYLRKGTKVLSVTGDNSQYLTEQSCFVSYLSDGLEQQLTPAKMRELARTDTENLSPKTENLKRKQAIAGEPIYKLVDGWRWYAVFWVDRQVVTHYAKNQKVTLRLNQAEIAGRVHFICDKDGDCLVLLEFDRYFKDLTKLRQAKAEIASDAVEGLVVANKSITSRDGQPGVFVRKLSGRFEFVPVAVILSDGKYSLLQDTYFTEKKDGESIRVATVKVYDEILNHPRKEKSKP